MFEEAFTMSLPALVAELRDIGVDEWLLGAAAVDIVLLRALYIYVHVEAINA